MDDYSREGHFKYSMKIHIIVEADVSERCVFTYIQVCEFAIVNIKR